MISTVAIVALYATVLFVPVVYSIVRIRKQQIEAFRSSLRPGDAVRLKTPEGMVHARIMKKQGPRLFTCMAIENIFPL
jgi:hypothetical protein